MTAASIDFSPLIPWSQLIALLAIGYAVLIFGAIQKLSGWLWRGLGLAALGVTLANPSLVEEATRLYV